MATEAPALKATPRSGSLSRFFAAYGQGIAAAAVGLGVATGCGTSEDAAYDALETSSFDFEELTKLVRENDVRRLEELLPLLPPDLRSQVVLMRKSQSLQDGATLAEPRVIMFGSKASLILAYAGSATQPAGQSLEAIQYRRPRRAWELRSIDFANDGAPPTVSEANPEHCLSCHGKDPRPNWNPYSSWPGAIAGDDDTLAADEQDIASQLTALQAVNARYEPLLQLSAGYVTGREPSHGFGPRTVDKHNGALTQEAAQWNFERVARLVQETPRYGDYKYAVLGSMWCNVDSTWLSSSVAGQHDGQRFPLGFDLLFDGRGINTDDWYMAFSRSHDFTTPGQNEAELTYALAKADSTLRSFVVPVVYEYPALGGTRAMAYLKEPPSYESNQATGTCRDLQIASLRALASTSQAERRTR